MAIPRSDLLHVLDAPLPNQIVGQELGELPQALGFAARGQQNLAEVTSGTGCAS